MRFPRGRTAYRSHAVLGAVAVALALLPATVLGAADARASLLAHRFTLYSVAEQEQFVNHQDDRIRGAGKNPFGNFRDIAPSTQAAAGPFPGDAALFSFNLYADSKLDKRVGTAVFTCMYNFAKNAFCDATFQLTSGATLIAAGAFNFNTSAFNLAVTGGTGTYTGASGMLDESPTTNNAQRLDFNLG